MERIANNIKIFFKRDSILERKLKFTNEMASNEIIVRGARMKYLGGTRLLNKNLQC